MSSANGQKASAGSPAATRPAHAQSGRTEEVAQPGQLIHMAVVYSGDGRVAVYRNGKPYADPYMPRGGGTMHFTRPVKLAHLARVASSGRRQSVAGRRDCRGQALRPRPVPERGLEASAESGPGSAFLTTAEDTQSSLPNSGSGTAMPTAGGKGRALEKATAADTGTTQDLFRRDTAYFRPHFPIRTWRRQKKLDKLGAGAVFGLRDTTSRFWLAAATPRKRPPSEAGRVDHSPAAGGSRRGQSTLALPLRGRHRGSAKQLAASTAAGPAVPNCSIELAATGSAEVSPEGPASAHGHIEHLSAGEDTTHPQAIVGGRERWAALGDQPRYGSKRRPSQMRSWRCRASSIRTRWNDTSNTLL